jgi:hypothetical protein
VGKTNCRIGFTDGITGEGLILGDGWDGLLRSPTGRNSRKVTGGRETKKPTRDRP